MTTADREMFRKSYDLHRLYYETPEENRNADFWRQFETGLNEVGKFTAQAATAYILLMDITPDYELHKKCEQQKIEYAQAKAAEREREEAARVEAEARRKTLAEVERLERELAQARAAL